MVDSIVTSYRTPGDLQDFLGSWVEHGEGRLWVMNVDPLPEHLDIGEYQDHPDISHIPVDYNCGYARANNLGASFGDSNVIAIFNADCILTPNTLRNCAFALMANKEWGALGPMQVDEFGNVTHAGIFGTNDAPRHRGWKAKDGPEFRDVQEAVTVSGSAYFIKRDVWDFLTDCPIYAEKHPEALGAFLPTPHYYEETFCSYHVREHGWKVMYYGKEQMIHKWHKASPVGGWAEQQMPISQAIFREMCKAHNMVCD